MKNRIVADSEINNDLLFLHVSTSNVMSNKANRKFVLYKTDISHNLDLFNSHNFVPKHHQNA